MTGELTPISNLVEKCHTWSPKKEGNGHFRYIDLSSVDKDRKSIIKVEEVPCQTAPSRARQLVKNGDILVSTVRPNLNGVAQVPHEYDGATASTGFCVLRPIPGKLNPDFLFHWVKTPAFVNSMMKVATGANYPAVSDRKVRASLIPCLPLPEQKRIAAILNAADALRAKRREALAQLNALLQSTFLEMFGDPLRNSMAWDMATIGDLLESANYGTSKKADPECGAYPVIRMNNITYRGSWDFSELKYIDLTDKETAKHLVHKGQILFNRTNSKELVGKTAVYRRDEPVAFAGYLVRGVVNEHADPEYIGAFMNTPHIKLFLRNKCKSIVGMANINAKEFQAIPIPKPPLELQNRFATIVQSAEQQKSRLRAHLGELDTLFTSLQARAFSGVL